jgi:hypothetical protein
MDKFSNTLSVRALNHWRAYSIPAYLGLRMLLQQVPKSGASNFLTEYLLNKLPLRKSGRYRCFLRFKGFSASGEIDNREMYAASPSTALAEAYALSLLSEISTLQNRPYVYSYLWPTSKTAGRSFTYFYSGYRERNARITDLLAKNAALTLVSEDIRSFYPSIDQQAALRSLINHLDGIEETKHRDFVESTCRQLTTCTTEGVPVGPALSHVLANLALERLDHEMYTLLKERYFRYVDDILMVLEKDEIPTVRARLEELLGEEGFELNPDKHDVVSSSDWLDNLHSPEEIFAGRQFDQLLNRIGLYLWDSPTRKDELAERFREKGIAMPIQRFALNVTYGRYHRYMKYLVNTTNIYRRIVLELKHENTSTIMSDVSHLYREFIRIASRIQIASDNDHQITKKLQAQRLRYLLNRLVYLTPLTDYEKLLGLAPDILEFYEYRSVIQSLITKSIDELIKIPGPAISTFASITKELELGEIKFDTSRLDSQSVLDSIATLLAFGVVELPESWIERLIPLDREYIDFCRFKPLASRQLTDFSYEDELRSLQINVDPSLQHLLMTTRFSDLENINLDALLMSAYGS